MFWTAVSQLAEDNWTSCCWKEVLVFPLPPPVTTQFCLHPSISIFPLVLNYIKTNQGGLGGKRAVVFSVGLTWWWDAEMHNHKCNAKKSEVTERQQPDLCETTLYTNWIKLKSTNMCHCLSLFCKPINSHFAKTLFHEMQGHCFPWETVNQLHSSSSPEIQFFHLFAFSSRLLLILRYL